jgi:DNA-binding response OmpR family regulator
VNKRIVVVDDNPLLLKTIDICLSKRGYDVNTFHNGADAVKHFFAQKPDLIMLDIRLPDCDGWFVAKVLEKLDWAQEVPLVVMSVLEPDRRKVAETKPFAYIQKPFEIGQLVQTVEKGLTGKATLPSMVYSAS